VPDALLEISAMTLADAGAVADTGIAFLAPAQQAATGAAATGAAPSTDLSGTETAIAAAAAINAELDAAEPADPVAPPVPADGHQAAVLAPTSASPAPSDDDDDTAVGSDPPSADDPVLSALDAELALLAGATPTASADPAAPRGPPAGELRSISSTTAPTVPSIWTVVLTGQGPHDITLRAGETDLVLTVDGISTSVPRPPCRASASPASTASTTR
jgi:hypothetical protein